MAECSQSNQPMSWEGKSRLVGIEMLGIVLVRTATAPM